MPKLVDVVKTLWERPGMTISLRNGLSLKLLKGRVLKTRRTFIPDRGGDFPATAFCLLAWASRRALEREEIGVVIKHAREGLQAPTPLAVKETDANRWAIIWDVASPKKGQQRRLL